MTVPVTGTTPNPQNTIRLRPRLQGLGECLEYDNDGNCVWDDSEGSTDPTGTYTTVFPPPIAPVPTPSLNSSTLNPTGSGASITSGYMGQSGAVILMTSDGGWIQINPDGSQAVVGPGHQVPASTGGTVTPQQASAWPSIVNAIANAGVRIATVSMLPAGASLTPNGTIVGRGQSLVAPGTITSSTITATISSMLSNPMVVVGIFGLFALAIYSGGRR